MNEGMVGLSGIFENLKIPVKTEVVSDKHCARRFDEQTSAHCGIKYYSDLRRSGKYIVHNLRGHGPGEIYYTFFFACRMSAYK